MQNNFIEKITVLMPVYNSQKYLKEAIESVLNQSFTDFEFIIINDCSSDDSKNIICSFHDNRIRYFENTDNLGVANSLNQGLTLARGEYIVRMDSDDIALSDRFEKLILYMDNHPDVSICGSWVEYIGIKKDKSFWFTFEDHDDIKTALLFGNAIAHPTVILKREIFLQNHEFYNPLFSKSEDYELWTRLVFKLKFANLQESLLKYRLHDQQASKKFQYISDNQVERIKQQYQKDILKKIELDISYMGIFESLCKKNIQNFCKTKVLIEAMSKNAFNKKILLSGMNFNRDSFSYMKENIDVGVNQISELLINIFIGSGIVLIGYGTLGKKIHNILFDKINFCAIADKNISEDTDIYNTIDKLEKGYKYIFLITILSIEEHIKIEAYIKSHFEHSTIIGFYVS
jgi:glycosyltransferase involved in cell wall biosynthesis